MGLSSYTRNLWAAVKGVPFRGDGGGGSFLNAMPWGAYNAVYPGSQINYAQEVGPLTNASLIMAAVNWAGTNFPEAPLTLVRTTRDGEDEVIPAHPMLDLLGRPTPYYSGQLLWKAIFLSWIIDGNAYLRKVRNAAGVPVELWYEPHFSIRPMWPQDGSEFISHYEVYRNGRWIRIESADVIHLRYGIDPYNERLGLSPVASAYREVLTDSERARYGALILRNGGAIPFILSPKDSANTLDPIEIKAEWEYRTRGDNVGRPMVLGGPVEAKEIGASPDRLLVDKASQIPEERIAALIGIPAAVLGFGAGLQNTKVGATMRELREQAYENFIIPTQRLLAPELDVQLLAEYPNSKRMRCTFDLSKVRVLQDDQNALATRHALLYEKGIETRAEARRAFGLPTDEEDEVYFVESAPEVEEETDPAAMPEDDAFPAAIETEDDAEMTDAGKARKAARLVGTAQEAREWWLRSAPDDAHGLASPEIVD